MMECFCNECNGVPMTDLETIERLTLETVKSLVLDIKDLELRVSQLEDFLNGNT